MTSTIDSTGATLDTLSEAKANCIDRLKAAFGENIKTDDQSLFGILSSVFGEMVSDQNELIRQAISARNPQGSAGTHLANIVQFNGVTRRSPEYSTVSLSCTAHSSGATIPAGSLVQDPTDTTIEFETDAVLVLAADETATVSATATAAGAIEATGSSLVKIVNPVYGWASVTNLAAAVAGRAVETDTDLRSRRKQVSRQIGLQSLPKVYAALTAISGIGRCTVRENRTSYVDSVGQLPHSVWAICQGGSDAEIAAALCDSTSGGIDYNGDTVITYTDPTMLKDLIIKFDRVTEAPIQIYLRLQKGPTYPSDGDTQIKDALIAYFAGEFVKLDGETDNGFAIAETVGYFRLLTPINSIGGHTVKEFTIARVSGTLATADLPMDMTELATLDASDIEIETW